MATQQRIIAIKNEKPELCAPCGGRCCRWAAGIYHPSQVFSGPVGTMKEMLVALSKKASMAHVEFKAVSSSVEYDFEVGDWVSVPVVMPRLYHSPDIVFRMDVIGLCIHHDENGCSLTHEDRPLECQMLEARANDECGLPATFSRERDLLEAWLPYRDLLHRFDDIYHRQIYFDETKTPKKGT